MSSYKLNDSVYPLHATKEISEPSDGYAVNNVFAASPEGKLVGYIYLEAGVCIECYTKVNKLKYLIIVVCVLVAIIVGLGIAYVRYPKDITIASLKIKTATDKDVVQYNGFVQAKDGTLEVDFQNGEQPATIQIVADGITSDPVKVKANELLSTIPYTSTTKDGCVNATLVVTTESSTVKNAVVIEIPENEAKGNSASPSWKGEAIYD